MAEDDIKVIEIIENDDGSATLVVDLSQTALEMVVGVGINSIIKTYLDQEELKKQTP